MTCSRDTRDGKNDVSCEEAFECNWRIRQIHAVPPIVGKSGCGLKRPRCKEAFHMLPHIGQLIQQRFPVGWHPSGWSRSGLIFRMRMRRKQLLTLDHPLLLVIEEPVLTRLKAGYDRMRCCRRMLGCMLARRTVTAPDVPTLRTPTEVKPPTFR